MPKSSQMEAPLFEVTWYTLRTRVDGRIWAHCLVELF